MSKMYLIPVFDATIPRVEENVFTSLVKELDLGCKHFRATKNNNKAPELMRHFQFLLFKYNVSYLQYTNEIAARIRH